LLVNLISNERILCLSLLYVKPSNATDQNENPLDIFKKSNYIAFSIVHVKQRRDEMTPQEIFDKVCTHLMTQRTRSIQVICAYRGENNTMCAIGCLLSDEMYCSQMEGESINGLVNRFRSYLPEWFYKHYRLLMDLQLAHDSYLSVSVIYCAKYLADLSLRYNLILPEIVKKELNNEKV
jgi:hypothetical protein